MRDAVRKAAAVAALLVLVATAAGGAWWLLVGAPQARDRAAIEAVDRFLLAWEDGDWPAMAARVQPGARTEAVAAHREAFAGLELDGLTIEPLSVRVAPEDAGADFSVAVDVEGLGRYRYESALRLVWSDGAWTVWWTPHVVHPAMVPDGRFSQSREWRPRAPILDRDGAPLAGGDDVVAVGIVPQRIADRGEVVEALASQAGADRERLEALLDRDDLVPDWFYPVVELPQARFEEVDAVLRPIPGVLFRAADGARAGPGGSFAVQVLGRTGEATAEQAAELGPPYEEGDVVGLYGLEAGLEQQLAGTPDLELAIMDGSGELVEVVHRVEGTEPRPVRITLDRRVQAAAESALGGLGGDGPPAALVAVDVSSSEILASANRPVGGFDRALQGRYPPGSTFKVVTAAALLDQGMTPESLLDCPAEARAGGRAFRNAGGLELGEIPLREAFAVSCNTAFVGQAEALGQALEEAAGAFGFDGRSYLPLPSFGGSFPEPSDATERAAAAIGQARVEASPLHMASVAAAAARGEWNAPRLVIGEGAGEGWDAEPRPLPGDSEALRAMMREVVASGTGTAAALEGEPVAGKTGSAEFGQASPPETHAWFIGFRGEVAFAVLVEGGGAGGEVAAPLARAFLAALP